jgi:hypothetical protein
VTTHPHNEPIADSLTDLARLIDRADAEASRLRARRLDLWVQARRAGLSWREIARASGLSDHATIVKYVNRREGLD